MTRLYFRLIPALIVLGVASWFLSSPDPALAQKDGNPKDDLADYRTVDTAVAAVPGKVGAAAERAAALGVYLALNKQGRPAVTQVLKDSPAAKAGLQEGDVLARVAGQEIKSISDLKGVLSGKRAGDELKLETLRNEKEMTATATLTKSVQPQGGGKDSAPPPGKGGWDARGKNAWKKPVYRLAVVLIEYPDVKGSPDIQPKHWDEAFFSRKTYNTKSATGQKVYGSLNDSYQEQSYGALAIQGKTFNYVQVSKNRDEYNSGTYRSALLPEALDKLTAREGKDVLKDFDGVFFIYAGPRPKVKSGELYWPHKGSVTHQGKRWNYFLCPEGGKSMSNISVAAHEFGHMIGLPDLYAAQARPGYEGLGNWCLMSNLVGNGRPQHVGAWCKEQMGWIKPVVLDPTVRQKLILAPIYKSPKECYKVLARADGSEYFLLEHRNATGFDASLPGQGLLVWRVVKNRPILEEAHGITTSKGPQTQVASVPFPSKMNDSFTPFTTPTSRTQQSGGLPVNITNIRRLPDGRIAFSLGLESY